MDYDMLLSKSIKTKKIIISEDINLYKERVLTSFNDSINNIHENEDIEECFNIYIQTLIRHYKKKDIIDSYEQDISMNQNEYEVAKSFFVNRTANEDAAAALTAAVIQAANELNIHIVDIINEFEKTGDLKSAIPTFLNLSRRTTSLLGYEQEISPNENIARQVVA